MSSSSDPRVRCLIQQAFPAVLLPDVLSVTRATSVAEGSGPCPVVVRGERLIIPYRVHGNAARLDGAEALSPVQREILCCIFTRHYDGRVRERALRQVIRSSNEWVIPFVAQLVGEYVIEIHRVVRDALPFLNGARYAAFIRENPAMYQRTRQRVVSCYHRYGRDLESLGKPAYPDRTGYPAFDVLKQFDSLLEATQSNTDHTGS